LSIEAFSISPYKPGGIVGGQLRMRQTSLCNIGSSNIRNNPNKTVLSNRIRCNSYFLKIKKMIVSKGQLLSKTKQSPKSLESVRNRTKTIDEITNPKYEFWIHKNNIYFSYLGSEQI
jgi:hypothetical protein